MSDSNTRNASEIIVALENKVDLLSKIIYSQDLILKVISNKLSEISELLKNNNKPTVPQFMAEAVDQEPIIQDPRNIVITPQNSIEVDHGKSIRRTSREPTEEKKTPTSADPEITVRMPIQVPRPNGGSEVVSSNKSNPSIPSIPIQQKILNTANKAVFMANVEVINLDTKETIIKTRTNGVGNWMGALPPGNYNVLVKANIPVDRNGSADKEMKTAVQQIKIDSSTKSTLPPFILK